MSSPDPARRFSPDEALPTVEPPSAGFIVQLFLIPGAIVVVIVLVSLLFNWLAHMETNPQAYLDQIEGGKANSWQAAHDLAILLSRDAALRRDPDLAGRLAKLLEAQLGASLPSAETEREQHAHLLVFLVRALGEMPSPIGLPALLGAAQTNRGPADIEVRAAALEALATLASRHQNSPQLDRGQIGRAMVAAAEDDSHVIRERAAYGLGVLGGSEAAQALERLAVDGYPDVRFNAATALARSGNLAALPVLEEMLDPDETAGVKAEQQESARGAKQALILINGLKAAALLAAQSPTADLRSLRERVGRVEQQAKAGKLPPDATTKIEIEAAKALRVLDQPSRPPQAARRAATVGGSTNDSNL
jgi:hypothetical protein